MTFTDAEQRKIERPPMKRETGEHLRNAATRSISAEDEGKEMQIDKY